MRDALTSYLKFVSSCGLKAKVSVSTSIPTGLLTSILEASALIVQLHPQSFPYATPIRHVTLFNRLGFQCPRSVLITCAASGSASRV